MYREFVGNLSDYPRSGVRGMMISSVGFTQQVIRLAQSDNIALAVLSEESNWETIIWRQINNFDQSQFKHKVLVGEFSTDYPIVYWGSSFITISDLLQECGIPMSKALYVPFMEDDEICEDSKSKCKTLRWALVILLSPSGEGMPKRRGGA